MLEHVTDLKPAGGGGAADCPQRILSELWRMCKSSESRSESNMAKKQTLEEERRRGSREWGGMRGDGGGAGTRDSQVVLLSGRDGWVLHREAGVTFVFDVTRCMFSSGNTTERARMGRLPECAGQTVVDLFAGIGYFTLPLLVRAGPSLLTPTHNLINLFSTYL